MQIWVIESGRSDIDALTVMAILDLLVGKRVIIGDKGKSDYTYTAF